MTKAEKKIEDIVLHPERHRHDFAGLQRCSVVDGTIDMAVFDAHSRYAGMGISRCDVSSGPCSCGAWH